MNKTEASKFDWLRTGDEAFACMLRAIDNARQSIRLETYIYQAGPVGERFRDSLMAACGRNVQVRVLVDAFGSINLSDAFWQPLQAAGGEFAWFNPISLGRWAYRNHRKLLVCDDTVAFIGGFNISDEYAGDGLRNGWRDLGLQVSGEIVQEFADSFDQFFGRADQRHKRLQLFRPMQTRIVNGPNWKLLFSGPGRRQAALKQTLARDLKTARNVRIICAYFLPTWRLRKALTKVCKRGGRVQLILAGKSDVLLSQLASRHLYRQLMHGGVEIFEYQPQILHAKLFIIDQVVYVGSANLDTRSLRINYELVLRLEDARATAEAAKIFEQDLTHSQRMDPAIWRRSRSFWSKLKESWAYYVLARLDPYLARRQLKLLR